MFLKLITSCYLFWMPHGIRDKEILKWETHQDIENRRVSDQCGLQCQPVVVPIEKPDIRQHNITHSLKRSPGAIHMMGWDKHRSPLNK